MKPGWVSWSGGKCPVKAGTLVETEWNYGGVEPADLAEMLDWGCHEGAAPEIIAYRVLSAVERKQFNKELRALLAEIGEQTGPDGEIYGHR